MTDRRAWNLPVLEECNTSALPLFLWSLAPFFPTHNTFVGLLPSEVSLCTLECGEDLLSQIPTENLLLCRQLETSTGSREHPLSLQCSGAGELNLLPFETDCEIWYIWEPWYSLWYPGQHFPRWEFPKKGRTNKKLLYKKARLATFHNAEIPLLTST